MIEYCQCNVDDETRRRLASLSNAREASCLGRCGRCYLEPFLVIDGEFRRGASHEALLESHADLAVADGGGRPPVEADCGADAGCEVDAGRDERERSPEGER